MPCSECRKLSLKVSELEAEIARLYREGLSRDTCTHPKAERHSCQRDKTGKTTRFRCRLCGKTFAERLLSKEEWKETLKRHGQCYTAEYKIWASMKARCSNPRSPAYPYYGGRGITFCDRWNSFVNFIADMGPRPSPGHSVERINNDGNYEPMNCKWATRQEQSSNRRGVLPPLLINGQSGTIREWAERVGISVKTLRVRLYRGWPAPEAISTPVDAHNKKHRGIKQCGS